MTVPLGTLCRWIHFSFVWLEWHSWTVMHWLTFVDISALIDIFSERHTMRVAQDMSSQVATRVPTHTCFKSSLRASRSDQRRVLTVRGLDKKDWVIALYHWTCSSWNSYCCVEIHSLKFIRDRRKSCLAHGKDKSLWNHCASLFRRACYRNWQRSRLSFAPCELAV